MLCGSIADLLTDRPDDGTILTPQQKVIRHLAIPELHHELEQFMEAKLFI